jgi:LPS sulfotransferase NodH
MVSPMNMFTPRTPTGNDHMAAVEARLGTIVPTAPNINRDMRYAFLCFTNRCGSNFVANALSSSGHLNRAGEYFNSDTIIGNCQAEKLKSVPDYFNWLTLREGRNGHLVAKTACSHLEILGKAGILERIFDRTRFVMIERSDKLAQSISYDLAVQTGRWTHDMASVQPDGELQFSHPRLRGVMDAVIDQNREFGRFFAANCIVPATIIYEQFELDPGYHVRFLARHLGIPELHYVPERTDTRKQRGPINREWRDRYIRETCAWRYAASPAGIAMP